MRNNRNKTQYRRKKSSTDISLLLKKKIQSENLEIIKGVTLQIVTAKVEKAKKDIHGNFIYKVHQLKYIRLKTTLILRSKQNLTSLIPRT